MLLLGTFQSLLLLQLLAIQHHFASYSFNFALYLFLIPCKAWFSFMRTPMPSSANVRYIEVFRSLTTVRKVFLRSSSFRERLVAHWATIHPFPLCSMPVSTSATFATRRCSWCLKRCIWMRGVKVCLALYESMSETLSLSFIPRRMQAFLTPSSKLGAQIFLSVGPCPGNLVCWEQMGLPGDNMFVEWLSGAPLLKLVRSHWSLGASCKPFVYGWRRRNGQYRACNGIPTHHRTGHGPFDRTGNGVVEEPVSRSLDCGFSMIELPMLQSSTSTCWDDVSCKDSLACSFDSSLDSPFVISALVVAINSSKPKSIVPYQIILQLCIWF